jgi:LAS superfamily LD-carboxypeptidase LdcB
VTQNESGIEELKFDEAEYDAPEPGDTSVYSGTPTVGGAGNNCTPIPDSQLVTFPSSATYGPPERATKDTVDRFMAMRAAALKDGVNIKVSDGYRSPEEQVSAWNGNGCRLVGGKTVCAQRTAAVPCSLGGRGSNHTSGTAIDVRLENGVYNWMKSNGGKYGFNNELANDKPHWSPSGK